MIEEYRGYLIHTTKHPQAGNRCWYAQCEGVGGHWGDSEEWAITLVKNNIDRLLEQKKKSNSSAD